MKDALVVAESESYDFSEPIQKWDLLGEPLFWDLTRTEAFRRLNSIRFLGAIDYLFVPTPNGTRSNIRHTRFQHSLGVARLALIYSDARGLSAAERRTIYVAALLHDIGHPPLSHSLESAFQQKFGIEHHQVTEDIIFGRSEIGREVHSLLRAYSVDIEHVVELIRGSQDISPVPLISIQLKAFYARSNMLGVHFDGNQSR